MTSFLPFGSIDNFALFTVVFGRMAGLFSAIPLLGGRRVPVRVKIGIVFVAALTLFPVITVKGPALPDDSLSLALIVIRETLIGLTLGLLSQAIFSAVDFCGSLLGTQMGFSLVTQFDPSQGAQTSIMTTLQNLLAALLFLSLGVHHIFIKTLVDSYTVIPIGGWHVSGALLEFLISVTTGVFVLAIKLAAPVMVSLLLATVVLGVMARVFPQMNILMISFPVNIGLGFMILGLSMLVFVRTLEQAFGGLDQQIKQLFRLLA